MSPMRFHQFDDHQYQQQKPLKSNKQHEYKINGARPTPLRLYKNSHVIHKSSSASSSTSSISTACSSTSSSPNKMNQYHRSNGPLIIHTYSPKVIHTKPRDFMALVQKLTGLSSVKHPEMILPRRIDEEVVSGDQDLNYDRRFMSEIPLFTPTGFNMFRPPQAHEQ